MHGSRSNLYQVELPSGILVEAIEAMLESFSTMFLDQIVAMMYHEEDSEKEAQI
jgi:hypothetical protein